MIRVVPIAVGLLLIGLAGYLHGQWTGRWASGNEVAEAVLRMADWPTVAGDWIGENVTINPREKEIAQADGMISRRYTNRSTGDTVSVMLLCGRSGPISVHPPEICFPGAGFREVGSPVRWSPKDSPRDQFWVRQFEKDAPAPIPIRLVYGWNDRGPWKAPDNPRWAFGGQPVLFKLYLTQELSRGKDSPDNAPALDLLRKLLPQLREIVRPNAAAGA